MISTALRGVFRMVLNPVITQSPASVRRLPPENILNQGITRRGFLTLGALALSGAFSSGCGADNSISNCSGDACLGSVSDVSTETIQGLSVINIEGVGFGGFVRNVPFTQTLGKVGGGDKTIEYEDVTSQFPMLSKYPAIQTFLTELANINPGGAKPMGYISQTEEGWSIVSSYDDLAGTKLMAEVPLYKKQSASGETEYYLWNPLIQKFEQTGVATPKYVEPTENLQAVVDAAGYLPVSSKKDDQGKSSYSVESYENAQIIVGQEALDASKYMYRLNDGLDIVSAANWLIGEGITAEDLIQNSTIYQYFKQAVFAEGQAGANKVMMLNLIEAIAKRGIDFIPLVSTITVNGNQTAVNSDLAGRVNLRNLNPDADNTVVIKGKLSFTVIGTQNMVYGLSINPILVPYSGD